MRIRHAYLVLILGAALVSCQAAVLRPLGWSQIPHYNSIPAPELLATAPRGLIVGDAAPFDGFLVATGDWRILVDEYARLQEALRLSQEGRGGDRASCDEFIATVQGEITRLQADRPRICAICAAGGSGLTAGVTGAIAAQTCD